MAQFIEYVGKDFKAPTLEIIDRANEIIEEYLDDGYELTLRQLYYQFVARDLIPNKLSEYKRLGSIINDARLAGLIDWEAIVDRTRNLQKFTAWASPTQALQSTAKNYAGDLWARQPYHVEVWIEKDALIGIVETACMMHRVPHYSCRGYTSQSEIWAAAQRFDEKTDAGKKRAIVIHLGDHDPSGIDMTRDIQDRLRLLSMGNDSIDVERIALSMTQVEEYKPPPNPAKTTDARYAGYSRLYGTESWELDALEPDMMVKLIRSHVAKHIDEDIWSADADREQEDRNRLRTIADNFDGSE